MNPLVAEARSVLDGNWTDGATKPAPALYPHQWSWDSAFVAIGNRHHRWERAVAELRSLFDAQWPNGLVPHIVFSDVDGDYFPSPAFWQADVVTGTGATVRTSGICQPPVHATALRLVIDAASAGGIDRSRVDAALAELVPRLAAWHDYLHRDRAVAGPLVEIWHPWESGMDNSPVWDAPLAALRFGPDDVPDFQRVDTEHANAADRPTDDDYDRYAYLVANLRAEGYRPANPAGLPFRVADVLFNSALVRAERDLAVLIELAGGNGAERSRLADRVADAIETQLWDEEAGLYLDRDQVAGAPIPVRISGGLMPLLLGSTNRARTAALIDTLLSDFAVPVAGTGAGPGREAGGVAVLTVPVDAPDFDATRYWRGPSWINMMWLLAEGLDSCGEAEVAARVRRGVWELVSSAGFAEYFDPRRGLALGGADGRFSWSAALLIDIAERFGASAGD
ncbi:MAG: trehalase family glycosidase [Actinomycetota bacterium]